MRRDRVGINRDDASWHRTACRASTCIVQDTVAKLKRNYDGYRFSEEETEGVYNPFSLLNVMESQRFADYWFMTATPTMLIELLRETGADLTHVEGAVRTESELMGLDPVRKDPIPLLFQSGYLTIKGTEYDRACLKINVNDRVA